MLDLALFAFVMAFLVVGIRRPFVWVLAYLYIDILAPQKIGWTLTPALPISLIAFCAAFGGWLLSDPKRGAGFTFRQGLMLALLAYCAFTTAGAEFPEAALEKWEWVWKALVFAIFLPLTLTTRLRLEGAALIMVLTVSAIIISAGLKTAAGGGGYESLYFFVNDNSGLYESSTLATVAISIIPLIIWFTRHGTVFAPDWRVKAFAYALIFACLLLPIGTEARTGLLCIAALGVLALRDAKRRLTFIVAGAALGLAALPFLPASYYERMATLGSPAGDESASTRVAVWSWTLDYAGEHPLGGGFNAYLGNRFTYDMPVVGRGREHDQRGISRSRGRGACLSFGAVRNAGRTGLARPDAVAAAATDGRVADGTAAAAMAQQEWHGRDMAGPARQCVADGADRLSGRIAVPGHRLSTLHPDADRSAMRAVDLLQAPRIGACPRCRTE